jgi:DNA repair protein RecN (Recombination protein N)
LPQVAAFADRHLVIARSDGQEVHSSSVSEVQQGERVAELSRMLAGLADSQAGTQLAEELLALAQVERKAPRSNSPTRGIKTANFWQHEKN